MKTFARISISLAAVAGLAGIAFAGGGSGAAPAPTAPDAKKAPAPAPAPGDKAPAMAMPKPPADIATAAKAMAGAWKCSGTAVGMDGKEMATKGSMKFKTDLDGFYIVGNFAETKKGGYKFTSMITFDGTKWSRNEFDNMGGHETAESTGLKDNKMIWEGTSTSSMGAMKTRHTEEMASPKENHMLGEMSMDAGKTWGKMYDITCKK